MTLSDTTTDTVSLSTSTSVPAADLDDSAAARADRLDAAGTAWGERIDARRDSAHLTYTVTGQGVGAVASTLRAGRHEFAVDE
ncbi:MAG: OsmC family peroxiredoxin, partial [Brachybacterium sp.]